MPTLPRDLNKITAAMRSTQQHWMRSSAHGQDGQLSVFTCACGEAFVPSNLAPSERKWPSMSLIHQSYTTAVAVSDEGLNLPFASELDEILPGSVFLGNDGKLYRSLGGVALWIGQDGQLRRDEPNLAQLTLVWSPGA